MNKASDAGAFDRLFLSALPVLRRRLLSQLGDSWEVDEAIQDVYVRLASGRNRQRCLTHPNPTAYLVVAASNVVRDAQRRQRRLRRTLALAHAAGWQGHWDGGIRDCESRIVVASALECMTAKEAQAIRLVDLHGHSLMEAGALLGVHWGTVHRNRKRGLDKLRTRFASNGGHKKRQSQT